MDDATASVPVPDVPTGVSSVEYAMVFQAEKPRLMRYLIQCGASYHAADDAAQNALMELYQKWETVRSPRAWLRKVALREFAKAAGAHEYSLDGHDQPLDPAEVESLLDRDAVLCAIRELPVVQRHVFALHFDQFTTGEIAEILRMTEAAARQNLARARARLKELLGLTQCGLTLGETRPALGSEGGI